MYNFYQEALFLQSLFSEQLNSTVRAAFIPEQAACAHQTYYSSQKLKVGITLFLAVACPLFLLMPAYATTLTVSNNADSGAGSLRQAIASANSGDTIDFASNLADSTITLATGELVIDKALTIASTVPVTVSGNSSSRVISTSLPLTLTGFTIADGSTPDDGAGVFAGDSLVVDRMIIRAFCSMRHVIREERSKPTAHSWSITAHFWTIWQ